MNIKWGGRPTFLIAALAAVALVAAACEVEDDFDDPGLDPFAPAPADTQAPSDEITPIPTPAAPADPTESPAEPAEFSATVEEMNGSGVSGEIVVTESFTGQAEVFVTLSGLNGGMYLHQITFGACGEGGEVVVSLDDMLPDEAGTVTVVATVDATVDELAEGHSYEVIENGENGEGEVIACATLEGEASSF